MSPKGPAPGGRVPGGYRPFVGVRLPPKMPPKICGNFERKPPGPNITGWRGGGLENEGRGGGGECGGVAGGGRGVGARRGGGVDWRGARRRHALFRFDWFGLILAWIDGRRGFLAGFPFADTPFAFALPIINRRLQSVKNIIDNRTKRRVRADQNPRPVGSARLKGPKKILLAELHDFSRGFVAPCRTFADP